MATGTHSLYQDSVGSFESLKVGGDDITATAAEINAAADVSTRLVEVPDDTTYTILAANSGKKHIVPDLTANCTFSFPDAAAGLEYEFWFSGAAADAQNWIFDTGDDAIFFTGGVAHLDTDAGSGGDEVVPVFSDGDSNSIFTVNVPQVGTVVKFISDGTGWYVNGSVVGATAPTFADQA